MKENKTVFEQLRGKKGINSLGLFIQFVLLITITILAICTMFIYELSFVVQALVVLLLFVMSFNNYKVFKRKGFTVLYSLTGLALLVSMLFGYFYAG